MNPTRFAIALLICGVQFAAFSQDSNVVVNQPAPEIIKQAADQLDRKPKPKVVSQIGSKRVVYDGFAVHLAITKNRLQSINPFRTTGGISTNTAPDQLSEPDRNDLNQDPELERTAGFVLFSIRF